MATATRPETVHSTYPADGVAKLFAPPETEQPADKLRRLLHEARDRKSFLHTAGAYDAFTSAIMTRLGFKALYPGRHRVIEKALKSARGNQKQFVGKIADNLRNGLEKAGVKLTVMFGSHLAPAVRTFASRAILSMIRSTRAVSASMPGHRASILMFRPSSRPAAFRPSFSAAILAGMSGSA